MTALASATIVKLKLLFIMERKEKLLLILDSFGVGVESIKETTGSTVTLYELKPSLGTRISKIRNLKDEIAVGMGVGKVRVIAPMANGMVGIEIPNHKREIVSVREMLECDEYRTTQATLPLALGKTMTNDILLADLAQMPHLLMAGATGQGKSVGLNTVLMSLIHKLSPDELKLVLIDPKAVELNIYSALRDSYLAMPVVTNPVMAYLVLATLCNVMDNRYTKLDAAGVRNIAEYNEVSDEKMPYVVVVIDEYGDLTLVSGKEMVKVICRLAQKARAVGIHLIVSTQRPSVKIVTGDIKANFPTRIAFRTTTGTDSRVILDQVGAEKLLGNGDMILFTGADLTRAQCAYASTDEVKEMLSAVRQRYDDKVNEDFPESIATYGKEPPKLLLDVVEWVTTQTTFNEKDIQQAFQVKNHIAEYLVWLIWYIKVAQDRLDEHGENGYYREMYDSKSVIFDKDEAIKMTREWVRENPNNRDLQAIALDEAKNDLVNINF